MLTNDELLTIIAAHRDDSLGVEDGQLSNERAEALDRYHGRPYGNEVEGRSAIVSKDLSEAVDWAMPAIMRIFTQTGAVCEFSPVSQEDEEQAEIETDYVNHVIMKDNEGWIVLHDAIKDTLLLKNGYVKHWWDVSEKIEEVSYQGLTVPEVQKLMGDLQNDGCQVDIKGQEMRELQTDMGPMSVFDLQLKITRKKGQVKVVAVPAEEIRVSRKCRGSLQDSTFVEHVTKKTRSDLIEMGMEKDFVYSLPTYEQGDWGSQAFSRDSVSDEQGYQGADTSDRSMDEIEYCEAYIKVDCDGDGIAELRKVVTVGNQIPEGDEWNEVVPEVAITSFVAKRVPHRHVGESLFDDLGDLQEIKTALTRQLFDNIYLSNNSQIAVNERVNIADFMTSQAGGIKRIEGLDPVAGAFQQIVVPNIVGDILPVIGYVDGIKENRTGISKASAGLDPDTLSNVTKGAYLENMNRASQKIEMITRMIAETGVKELCLRVHSLLNRYQDKARIIRMKGKYVPVNPQEWRERTDLTIKVGLGTGTEEMRQQKLMLVSQLQQSLLAPIGLVGPKQAYALFDDLVEVMGFEMAEKYAMDPESPEYQQKMQQPQQPPLPILIEQIKQQGEAQKFQAESQQAQMKSQAELQFQREVEQMKADAQLQATRATLELQAANDARDSEREVMKAQLDQQLKAQELEFQKWKAELDARVKLRIAAIGKESTGDELMASMAESDVMREQSPIDKLAAMHAETMQMMATLAETLAKPKQIVRDANGRAQGVV